MAVRARRRSILRARRSPSARRRFVKLTFRRLERSERYRQTEIYAPGVAESDDVIAAEPWGEDRKLLELLGVRGAAGFRAMFDGFPEAVGVLWAFRDAEGEIADFTFGYGNPRMLRALRLPAATRNRYTLLEALPQMRGSRAFVAYVDVCESGRPWLREVRYDTPFGDGYMLGTFVHRSVKLGDGLVNFLTDVTAQRRMEAELRNYADVVAHDLREPIAGIAMLVNLLERRAEQPPSAAVLSQLRASTGRAADLIDGVLVYTRAGNLETERVALDVLTTEVAQDLRASFERARATLEIGELPEVDGDPVNCAACCRISW